MLQRQAVHILPRADPVAQKFEGSIQNLGTPFLRITLPLDRHPQAGIGICNISNLETTNRLHAGRTRHQRPALTG